MIQAYLDNIKEDAARIVREYTNKECYAALKGERDYKFYLNESKRCVYFAGIIDHLYLVDETPYLGGTEVTEEYVTSVVAKIWHYSGVYADTELDSFLTITPDDGDGGACEGSGGTTDDDHYRSGSVIVTAGPNPVTFIKNGVASPLPSALYTVRAWAITESGQLQSQVVVTNQVAAGFTASDVLKAGTLYYQATLDT